ncbi:MAG TPA: ATP-binding protein [Steroidobacteraceae bacterium]|nr:ATP-binding protein [Steroidobacteraceae bacterium]
MSSLSGRLLASVSLLLILFFGVTIAALDAVFRDLSQHSIGELLDAQLVALLAACEPDDHGNVQPAGALAETRLRQPGSGLYAEIESPDGKLIWRSPSLIGNELDFGGPVPAGSRRLEQRVLEGGRTMVLSASINWEIAKDTNREFVFNVATSLAPYEAQLARFRSQMLGWFLGLFVLLVGSLALLLRWALGPLRQIEAEIGQVEAGERTSLSASQPRELQGLAANMNALLKSERQRVERYRNTLGNLAHSLKTPLAVIRSTLAGEATIDRRHEIVNQQIDRMNAIVQHQLKRAGASGGAVIGQGTVEVVPLLTELRGALSKVYSNRDLLIEISAAERVAFTGDRGDLFELLGNLLDNACKWCHSRVRVTVGRVADTDARTRLKLTVEDDGVGIASADRQRILERGARADEHVEGQGLGLAMVREIVELYDGTLEIGESPLGGAQVTVCLPGR